MVVHHSPSVVQLLDYDQWTTHDGLQWTTRLQWTMTDYWTMMDYNGLRWTMMDSLWIPIQVSGVRDDDKKVSHRETERETHTERQRETHTERHRKMRVLIK